MSPGYIFKILHIKGDAGKSFILLLYNQPKTKKVYEPLPPSHFTIFTKVMYMYLYTEYYV